MRTEPAFLNLLYRINLTVGPIKDDNLVAVGSHESRSRFRNGKQIRGEYVYDNAYNIIVTTRVSKIYRSRTHIYIFIYLRDELPGFTGGRL